MAISLPVPYPTDGLISQKTGQGFRRDLWIPSSFDYNVVQDDFTGDRIKATYPAAKTSTGIVTFTEHNIGGYLELKSGALMGNYAGQGYGMNWSGDQGYLFEAIVQLPSVITDFKFEVGMSDNDQDAGAVAIKSSPSSTADDYAVFILDTTHNTSFDLHSDIDGGVTEQVTTGLLTLAASAKLRLAIRADGDDIQAWVNGQKVAEHALGLQGGDGVTPWFFSQTRTNSTRILRVYKWRITSPAY